MALSNSKRFIDAYNQIDNVLRNLYGYKDTMTFSDIVRRSAALNYVVRKYEEDLIDFARLRNAIIHKSNGDNIIAEPHADVADKMQHIARLLTTPPAAYTFVKSRKVMTFPYDARLRDVVSAISSRGYSNIPIIKDGVIIGVLSNKQIVEELGRRFMNKQSADDFFNNTYAGDILLKESPHYVILKKNATIESVLNLFQQDRRLRAVLFTEDGSNIRPPVGIVTMGDLLDLNEKLDDYSQNL